MTDLDLLLFVLCLEEPVHMGVLMRVVVHSHEFKSQLVLLIHGEDPVLDLLVVPILLDLFYSLDALNYLLGQRQLVLIVDDVWIQPFLELI